MDGLLLLSGIYYDVYKACGVSIQTLNIVSSLFFVIISKMSFPPGYQSYSHYHVQQHAINLCLILDATYFGI